MRLFLAEQWVQIRGNVKYDIVRLAGAAMIAATYTLLQKLRHLSPDWYVAIGLFVISAFCFFYFSRKAKNLKMPTADGTKSVVQEHSQDNENLVAYAASLGREITSLREQLREAKGLKPKPLLAMQETQERALTPAELESNARKLAAQLGALLIENGHEVKRESTKKLSFDVPPIDETVQQGFKDNFRQQVLRIRAELGEKGLLNDRVGEPTPVSAIGELVKAEATSADDIRDIMDGLLGAAKILKKRFLSADPPKGNFSPRKLPTGMEGLSRKI